MKVFKFGGASVSNAASIKNVVEILQKYACHQLVVVVSALGGVTNLLESITRAYFDHQQDLDDLLTQLKKRHYTIAQELFETNEHKVFLELDHVFKKLEELFSKPPIDNYHFLYDQIVSVGELLSSKLAYHYALKQGLGMAYLDARSCIKTDNSYREAKVNWPETRERIASIVPGLLQEGMVLTQGFIGGTAESFTTTLGREGSDYSAAIFGNCLDATEVMIWKDVPGILNADPKHFEGTKKISRLSYYEAIEMAYYGAKVIHPKTIKPLQNKEIPLSVKPFADATNEGTSIRQDQLAGQELPPVIVVKPNQILVSIITKDFSFIAEENLSYIYTVFAQHRIKINLSQNAALSFSACIDNQRYKIERLKATLDGKYKLLTNSGLELITIRHYNDTVVDNLVKGRVSYLEQKSRNTIQFLVKEQQED